MLFVQLLTLYMRMESLFISEGNDHYGAGPEINFKMVFILLLTVLLM